MSKKIKNKKGIALGALLGASIGTTAAFVPHLFNDKTKKAETVNISEFEATNIGLNSATVKFKLDLEKLPEKYKQALSVNPKLNVNIIEAKTNRIADTDVASYNEETKQFSLDVTSLKPGKIYNLQVVDLKHDNLTFEMSTSSGFIITKPELEKINYSLDKRSANLELYFSDEEKILVGKDVTIQVKNKDDQSAQVQTITGKVVAKESQDLAGNNKTDVFFETKLSELKRNNTYEITSVKIDDREVESHSSLERSFKTTIPTTIVTSIEQKTSTKNQATGELYFSADDVDAENKQINVTYAKIGKDEHGNKTGYASPVTLPNLTLTKVKKGESDVYKVDLTLNDLEAGSSYEIIRLSSINSDDLEHAVNAVLPREEADKWVLSTQPVVQKINVDTQVEKTAFVTVTLKDDSYTKNGQSAYLKYALKTEKDDTTKIKTVKANVVGNFIRFTLQDLQGLLEYQITEVGIEEKTAADAAAATTTAFDFVDGFDDATKTFIPTVSTILIHDVNVTEIKESTAKVVLEFEPNNDFILNRKAKLKFSALGSNDEVTFPSPTGSESTVEGKVISKTNDKLQVEFDLTNLNGGTSYSITGLTLDEDSTKSAVENNLKIDFSINLDGSKRRFITKPVVKDINYTNSDTSASLTFTLANSYQSGNNDNFEGKTATIKYKLKVDANANPAPSGDDTAEKTVTGTVQSNYIVVELDNLTPNKTFEITSVEVQGYTTSTSDTTKANDLLHISSNITEEQKLFYTTAISANINNIVNTPQTESTSKLVFIFDEKSRFLATRTVTMTYRKLNASVSTADSTMDAVVNADGTLTYDLTGLEIGSKYIVKSLAVKRTDADAADKPLTRIVFDANTVTEDNKIFRTTNGVSHLEFRTPVETKARVVVTISDASQEYANKKVKLTYAKIEANDSSEVTTEAVDIVNGKAVFDLSNLEKVKDYKITHVKFVNGSNETDIPLSTKLTEDNKKFTTSAQTAKVQTIEEDTTARTKNSAAVTVSFANEDSFFADNQYTLTMKYKLRGSNEAIQTATGNLETTGNTKKYKFTFSNLKEGAVYYIIGFDGSKDNKNVDVILDNVQESNKQFSTKATINSISVNTSEEAKARIVVRFNDAKREIVNKELQIKVKKQSEKDDSNATTYTATATSDSGLYVFNLDGLPKTEKVEIISISYRQDESGTDYNQQIDFGAEQQSTLDTSKVFIVSATSATVNNVSITAETRNSATVTLTFDTTKDSFVNSKKLKLKYKGQDSANIIETTGDGETISNGSVTVKLTGLKEGIRYEVVGFTIENLKSNFDSTASSQADISHRTFVTKSAVSRYEFFQTSETSTRVVVSIEDNARVKENFKAKLVYHKTSTDNSQATDITTDAVSIVNGRAIFELTGLTKSGSYTIKELQISDQVNSDTNLTKLDELSTVTADSKQFTLTSQTSEVTSVTSTTTLNNATVTIKLGAADAFTIGKQATLKLRKQGSDTETSQTVALTNDNSVPKGEFTFNSLDSGSIYVLTGISITDVPKTNFAQSITDASKQVVTTPLISRLIIAPSTETTYGLSAIIRDPLSGSGDNRSFDNKKVKITYYATDSESTKLTVESTISLSRIDASLTNLVKSKTYKIEKIEYSAAGTELTGDLTALTFTSEVTEENKQFTVTPKTAQITELSYESVTNNSGTVKVKFAKSVDEYLSTSSKQLKIKYRSSEDSESKESTLSSATLDGENVVYSFDLQNLGHGSSVRIISGIIEGINVNFASSITAEQKQFNTTPTVRNIRNFKADEEGSWNIEVRLKDLKETSANKQIKIKYVKESEENTELTSEPVTVSSNRATIKVTGLEKYTPYKIKQVILVDSGANPQKTNLDFESSVEDTHKQFKVIPKLATIEAVEEKTSTTTSSSFVLHFSDADRNYLTTYHNITIKYRQKGQTEIKEKNGTVDTTALKASFSFTVGQDSFVQASYEILSVIFQGDQLNSGVKNTTNNPEGVLILFKDTLTKNDRTFATTTDVSSISTTPDETTAEVTVKINDNSQTYVGSRIKVVYTLKDGQNEITSSDAEIVPSNENGKSEAVVTLTGLQKEHTYTIKKVLINNIETPFASGFEDNSKTFKTVGKTATVTSITQEANSIAKDTATVTVTFDSADAFLEGSTTVEPATTAKNLYLIFSSKTTGAVKNSSQNGTNTAAPATAVTKDGNTVKATFNLSGLDAGDTYEVISVQERVGEPQANDVQFTLSDSLTNKDFKTLPALGSITKNVNIEKKAILTIDVVNANDIVEPSASTSGTLTYTRVADNSEHTASFTYNNKTSIQVELNDLQKDEEYQVVKATINGKDLEFTNATNTDANKKFRTSVRTAEVTVTANSDKQVGTGTFTLTFGNQDEFLNKGWTANISYQATNGLERKITHNTSVDISNKSATFTLSGLTGGQTYQVTDITLTKKTDNTTSSVSSVLARMQGTSGLINTKAQVKGIRYVSASEGNAAVTVSFDNTNLDIANNGTVAIEYELVNALADGNHSGSATATVTVSNNNNNSIATFDLTNLVKGQDYKITAIKKDSTSGKSLIFNTNISQDTNPERRFKTITQTGVVSAISFANQTVNSANVTLTFEDEFIKTGQQVSLLYRKVGTTDSYNTALVEVGANKQVTVALTNLQAGSQYEVIGGTLIPSSASVTIKQELMNNNSNKFYTKPEISAIEITPTSETEARVVLTFADGENSLNGHSLHLTAVLKNSQDASSNQNQANATVSNGSATFNLSGLTKYTEYKITSVADTSNNSSTEVPYNPIFADNTGELRTSKEFRTLGLNTTLEFVAQTFGANSTDATTESAKVKFTVAQADRTFAKNKNISLRYVQLDSTGNEMADTQKTSPLNARLAEDGNIEFDLTKASDGLLDGTKYKVKEIIDLSPASERITFNLPSNNSIFETLVKQPQITKIESLKSEHDTSFDTNNPLNIDTTKAFKTKFNITFDDPKSAIKWDTVNDWSIQAIRKGRHKGEADMNIKNSNIHLSRLMDSSNNPTSTLQVEITTNNIEDIVGSQIVFQVNALKYGSRVGNTSDATTTVTIPHIAEDNKGIQLVGSTKAKLFVESIAYTSNYGDKSYGITFKIFDPRRSFKNTREFSRANDRWVDTLGYSSLNPVLFLKTTDGFGAPAKQGFTTNSDHSNITGAKFITETSTKATSGFKLKQSANDILGTNPTWESIRFKTYYTSTWRDETNPDYTYVSLLSSVGDESEIWKLFQKYVKVDESAVFSLLKYVPSSFDLTPSNDQYFVDGTSDVSEGSTLASPGIYNSLHYFAPLQQSNADTHPDSHFNLAVRSNGDKNDFIFENKPGVQGHNEVSRFVAFNKTVWNNADRTLKMNYFVPATAPDRTVNAINLKGYAVFEDRQGNLYFAGDENGNPQSLATTDASNNSVTFYVNYNGIAEDEKAPDSTEFRLIGVWSQKSDDAKIAPVLIHINKQQETLIQFEINPVNNTSETTSLEAITAAPSN
ncbi:hypothetical protein ACXX84_02210 [Mycoplasma sp. AC157]